MSAANRLVTIGELEAEKHVLNVALATKDAEIKANANGESTVLQRLHDERGEIYAQRCEVSSRITVLAGTSDPRTCPHCGEQLA
jgi:rRNA maturation endonuclease Nob1